MCPNCSYQWNPPIERIATTENKRGVFFLLENTNLSLEQIAHVFKINLGTVHILKREYEQSRLREHPDLKHPRG